MLTGDQLFQGETISDTLAAVLTREPDWTRVPVKVRRLLQSCLQKDPKQRLQAIGDWRLLLLDEAPEPAPTPKGRPVWPAVAAAFAILAGLAFWAPWHAKPGAQPLMRLDVDLGSDVSLGSTRGADVILSPDGTRLVYVSKSRLFTRRLDESQPTELAGTEGAFAPFFSPEGEWVAFFTQSKLSKVSVHGGVAVSLFNFPSGTGGSWGEDGYIVASVHGVSSLWRIPSSGGAPTRLTELAPGEFGHRWPQILPGGKAVLFTVFTSFTGADGANIEVLTLGDGRRKILQRGGTFGRVLSSGHLVYIHQATLFAAPFDLGRLEMRGAPMPVLGDVGYENRYGSAQLDFSRTGTLLYRSGASAARLVTAQWLDGTGKASPLLAKPGDYFGPRLSPDNTRLALVSAGDIWVYELRRETLTRLTHGMGANFPVWTPDNRHILFQAPGGIFWTRSDGSSNVQPLTRSNSTQTPGSITADGKRLAFSELSPKGLFGTWTVPLESDGAGLGAGKPELFLQMPVDVLSPRFSPEGRWVAYGSAESGAEEVYVRAFPDRGGKWQVSNGGGMEPLFARGANCSSALLTTRSWWHRIR
jgi:serine/threonine-protein kinase